MAKEQNNQLETFTSADVNRGGAPDRISDVFQQSSSKSWDGLTSDKEKQQQIHDKLKADGWKVVDRETGHELPQRTLFLNKNRQLARTTQVWVGTLASLTPRDLNLYLQRYKDDLSIAELEAIDLILKSQAGQAEAKERFWAVQNQLFQAEKSLYIEQLRQQGQQGQEQRINRLEALLNQAGDAILASEKAQGKVKGKRQSKKSKSKS